MKRALLLFNPQATSVSPAVRDVIAHALQSEVKLEVAGTKRRHHATHLASGAAHEGFDLVVALGGDGTMNEVAQGLIGTETALVPLPGGSTNVFTRMLGLPRDPVEATADVLGRIHDDVEPRRVTVGKVNDRYFVCNAGIGFDAAVVRAVERRFKLKRHVGDPFFVYQALRLFFFAYPRKDPPLRMTVGDRAYERLHQVIVCNGNPYTFLGERPFQLCPYASLERGLDVTALARFGAPTVISVVLRAFGSGGHTRMRAVTSLHDLDGLRVGSKTPVGWQVDGDFAGEDTTFEFATFREALSVVA